MPGDLVSLAVLGLAVAVISVWLIRRAALADPPPGEMPELDAGDEPTSDWPPRPAGTPTEQYAAFLGRMDLRPDSERFPPPGP